MSNKVKWTQIDKRILDRRIAWSAEERAEHERELMELPDCADKVEPIDIPQPAFEQPQEENKEEEAAAAAEATPAETAATTD